MKSALNPAQESAATTLEGPVLVIAGAGTGKTHTLVHRLVNLTRNGVPPESILLLTFTRRAAEEMSSRAAALTDADGPKVSGGTYHSFAHSMLRRFGSEIGIAQDFSILDQADVFQILGSIRAELKAAEGGLDLPRRETIAAVISKAVNQQVAVEDVVASEFPQFFAVAEYIDIAAARYEKFKAEGDLLDFDNLLVLLIRLLEESDRAQAYVAERYRYVMVDEYQDTNVLQARITHLLSGDRRNLMVVGDDAQSIYAFRGARHRNLFEFKEHFPDARLVTLETNYRSTQAVLDVANALMVQMSEAFQKRLVAFEESDGDDAPLPVLVEAANAREQAVFVADEILRLSDAGVRLAEMAVLFRASRHAFPLELELSKRGLGFVKYGGFRFVESAHIKDVLAHLRLIDHPGDALSLERVLLLRKGIGKKGARGIIDAVGGDGLVDGLRGRRASARVAGGLRELADLIEAIEKLRDEPARCLEAAVEAYAPLLEDRYDDWPRRKRDLETLVGLVEPYRSLQAMLSELTLDPPSMARDGELAKRASDELVLSTMHSAKGLEWRAVFIIELRDGAVPMISRFDGDEDPEALDEELRLLYVAVTRAKRFLFLVWPREVAQARYQWPTVSRFLAHVPEEYLERNDGFDGMF